MKTVMYTNVLSPVLEEILASDNRNDIVHLEISDSNMLKDFFTEHIIHSLMNRRRVLVVIPDSMDCSIPSKILANHQLGHLSAIYSKDYEVNLAERIRAVSRLTQIPLLRQEYEHIVLKYKEMNTKIFNTLQSINKKSIKRPAFKQMLLSIKPRPKSNISASVVEKISNINLNPTVLSQVKHLQNLFEPRFMFMDQCSRLSSACLEDDTTLKFAKDEIEQYKTDITMSIQNIEQELYLMKRVISYELEEEIASWTKISDQLQEVLLENELDSIHSSFEDQGFPIIRKFNGFKYLKLSLNVTPEKGWGQVANILSVVNAVIDSARASIDIYFQEYVNRLSPFNTNNEILDGHVNLAADILNKINNTKYLQYNSHHQFLQVDSLLEILKEARDVVVLSKELLDDKEYIAFQKLLRDIGLDQKVLQSLYSFKNEDWSTLLEFYGQRSHLINGYSSNMTRLDEWTQSLKATHQLIRHTSHKELHNRWCIKRDQALSFIKNNNWDAYNKIFESSQGQLNFHEVLRFIGASILDFFPVLVLRNSELRHFSETVDIKMEDVFFLDVKDIATKDIDLLKEKNAAINISSTYSLDLGEISSKYDVISNYCSTSCITHITQLKESNKSDRYKLAVALSSNIKSVVKSVNIYKINNKVIISTLDPILDQRISTGLKIESQNILFQKSSDMAHLVETIIHYDDLTLLIENNLLNDQSGQTSLWQRDVLTQITDSGIRVININTHELYSDLFGTIRKVVQTIGPRQTSTKTLPKTSKKALILEN